MDKTKTADASHTRARGSRTSSEKLSDGARMVHEAAPPHPPLLDVQREEDPPTLDTVAGSPFTNRELSWLEFNARVLDETRDPTVPLLERLKFLAIFSSNLDEFFMVRYAGIWRQIDAGVETPGPDGMTPRKVLEAISRRVHELVTLEHHIFESLLPELWANGIQVLHDSELSEPQQVFLQAYFDQTLLPIITPMAIDPGHPFPYLANRSLCLVAELEPIEAWAMPMADTSIIHIPAAVVSRFIRLPTTDGSYAFLPLESAIRLHVSQLYPGCRVNQCSAIRVTRDGEIDISDEQADLLSTIEEAVRKRRLGAAVRLQYEIGLSPRMLSRLTQELELDPVDLFPTTGLPSLTDVMQIWSQVDLPQGKERPILPQPVSAFDNAPDLFTAIRNGDILLYHPYQDFDYVVRFITAAASDPDVLAIKMTLYRMSGNSSIARALLTAARNGKEVAALVELRARFDEEANIAWARRLESTGAHVIYGIAGYKTHCKAALVVRREGDTIRRYCHLSTGNYNDQTARIYTDLSLFTCQQSFGEDLTHLFNLLTGYARPPKFKYLILSPTNLRHDLIMRIRREADHARAGRQGHMILKMNGLSDQACIQELYLASQAGVTIELLVRGICCLRPGVKGLSENIRVLSIVDRFLEHARIYYFAHDGNPEYFLSSADIMGRNLDGRVEIAFPLLEPALQAEAMQILQTQLADTVKARVLRFDSTSTRIQKGEPLRSQERLAEMAQEKGRRSGIRSLSLSEKELLRERPGDGKPK